MNITLTWTAGGGATSQDVQYKLASASSWTTHSNVAGNITTASITGLQDNLIYDFRVITNCAGGTPTPSTSTQQIKIICPTVTATPSDTTIAYSFPEIGGSVTAYTVKLFDSAGTTELSSQTPTGTTTRSGTFTGLTQSTAYKIRVIITAGSFTKSDCAFTSASTTATPACNAPTNVSASIDPDVPTP
jgi:trimeric autotransporter adhesin